MTGKTPDPTLVSLVDQWLAWDQNPDTRQEVKQLVEDQKWDKLEQIMNSRLQFGTAGIRGRMGPGFAQLNSLVIVQVTQGLLAHLQTDTPDLASKGVVIGYDGRHHSHHWAKLAAGVFLRHSVPVFLFSRTVATPLVPFTVVQQGAAAGVMVTASHNPRWDNGYKVYWGNGAQILSPHDSLIQAAILDNLEPGLGAFTEPEADHPLLTDVLEMMTDKYLSSMQVNNSPEVNRSLEAKVVYSAMHGVGCPFVVQAWQRAGFPDTSLILVEEQKDPDPDFSTVDFPNPEEGATALDLSFKQAALSGAQYIMANDPDADRLGVAQLQDNGEWKIFNGNELGALLGWWLLACYKRRCLSGTMNKVHFIASTVSSKILASIARIEGLHFTETLTGFKHMGNMSHRLVRQGETVLFAFEEAIGFMCGTEVLDKDGVSALVTLTELVAHMETRGLHLTDQLDQIYLQYGFHCSDNSYFICRDPEVIEQIFSRLRNFEEGGKKDCSYPRGVCDGRLSVLDVRDLTTGHDSRQEDHRALLPLSSQMVSFWLDNGVVVTLRTSGTEPKLKYYAELCGRPDETDWEGLREDLRQTVKGVVEEWLEPGRNGLEPRPE